MSAPVTIVDENDQPIGQATKAEIWEKGLRHRIVQIVVESPEGKVLLQRRGPDVALSPNYWDFAAAGHVDAGEDYLEAAQREVREELGLSFDMLQQIAAYKHDHTLGDKKLYRFYRVYKTTAPEDTVFTVQPEEVGEVKWFTREELKQLLAQKPDCCTSSLRKILEEFYTA